MGKAKTQSLPSIIIKGLSKRYPGSEKLALDNLSLDVYPGEVYGFLGPNGAGKSTTIRLLMNYLQPTSGEATILEKNIVSDSVAIKKTVGYLAGDFPVYPKMTGSQYLEYTSSLQGVNGPAYDKNLAKRLGAELDKKLGDLSRGNRQKIGILQAFQHKPEILILDEPTTGLDPLMQEVFVELIAEAKARKATVFISSHIISEIQKVCDRIGIIKEGRLVTEKSIAELVDRAAQIFDIVFLDKAPVPRLKKIPGLKVVSYKGNHAAIQMQGKLAPLFAVLAEYEVTKIDARNLDLEEIFMKFYTQGENEL